MKYDTCERGNRRLMDVRRQPAWFTPTEQTRLWSQTTALRSQTFRQAPLFIWLAARAVHDWIVKVTLPLARAYAVSNALIIRRLSLAGRAAQIRCNWVGFCTARKSRSRLRAA